MNQAIEEVRTLLRQADEALSRQAEQARTPHQRDEDLADAQRAHRTAVAILDTLQAKRSGDLDDALVAALAPLQIEVVDLEILMAEIRFDEEERTERLPRLRHADT